MYSFISDKGMSVMQMCHTLQVEKKREIALKKKKKKTLFYVALRLAKS